MIPTSKKRSEKERIMAKTISYNRLWKLLIDRKMKRADLKDKTGISTASIAKLGKDENITTAVLLKICNGLDCDLSDIMELVPSAPAQRTESEETQHGSN